MLFQAKLRPAVRTKRHGVLEKGVDFHRDYTTVHIARNLTEVLDSWQTSVATPNYVDCSEFGTSSTPWRRCCESEELPKGCECFDITFNDFKNTGLQRPQCPEDLGLTFWLYQELESTGTQIKVGDLSTFDPSLQTRVLGHGFLESKESWGLKLKDALLNQERMNVIAVDYEDAVDNYEYLQAAANSRSVGAMIGRLLQDLHESAGSTPDKFHLIGHSLGSHVMGYAGVEFRRLTGANVGRITGLDPAGLAFWQFKDTVYLDKADGDFVDIIHTNAAPVIQGGFGFPKSAGSADFYVNGGEDQPECPPSPLNLLYVVDLAEFFCSHRRSVTLFINSVNDCQFQIDDTLCAVGCLMGFDAGPVCEGDLQVTTTGQEPYCVNTLM
ncbi:pancreatic lipase-related protein 2-like [Aplysia californica]|uniref:Pancreatic lipase-related protein 2-like n=1 Tax=Aplysia californica TaxID=6500 RepID=A0ABM0ZWB7_APLCA|nr:pancreatic lipase-related protein 2-like [Aplysia californica]